MGTLIYRRKIKSINAKNLLKFYKIKKGFYKRKQKDFGL